MQVAQGVKPNVEVAVAAPGATTKELDETVVYDVLRYAVNLVKQKQIGRLDSLRVHLNHDLPGMHDEIEAAIKLWANYVHGRGHPRRYMSS